MSAPIHAIIIADFADISDLGFDFEIFASGEYSRMLEREWAEDSLPQD